MMRGSIQPIPYSAGKPSAAKAVANRAESDAHRTSAYVASTMPAPAHAPLIAAMTGVEIASGAV